MCVGGHRGCRTGQTCSSSPGPQKSPADPTRAWQRWGRGPARGRRRGQQRGERASASSLGLVSPLAPPAGWVPAVALGSPRLSTVKSKVKETRGRREAGGRSLQPGEGVAWEEPEGVWVEKGAGQARGGGLATQARGAAPRTPRGSL